MKTNIQIYQSKEEREAFSSQKNQCQRQALMNIKAVVDAYNRGSISITANSDKFDTGTHTYDIGVIMGIIMSHTYCGLGLNIPKISKKGENI